MKSLKERSQEFGNQLPFMQGRNKGELDRIKNTPVTIREYGFMTDTDEKTHQEKDYVCFIVDEDPQNFYFGGQVLTENMKSLEAEGYADEIRADGLPVELGEKKSRGGNKYTTVTFYPESMVAPADGKKK